MAINTSSSATGSKNSGGLIDPDKEDEFDKGKVYYDENGNKITKTSDGAYGSQYKTSTVDPQDQLKNSLLDSGVDPSKVQSIVDSLLANAGTTPTVGGGNVPDAKAAQATASQAGPAPQMDEMTLEDATASGVGIGNTEFMTDREVTEDELVSTQMEGLLDEESKYIKLAKQRAIGLANQRGQLGSSFAAGAAHRAAIEAALPIATADAQAYRDVAAANMNAYNEAAMANLQRATAIDTALLDANTRIGMANMDSTIRVSLANLEALTQVNIANLDAKTRTNIANLQSKTTLEVQKMQNDLNLIMQNRELTHQVGMEQLQQSGRVELALLDVEARKLLAEMGFEHDFNMSELDHEEQLEVNEILQGYQLQRDAETQAHERRSQRANLAMQAQMNYINYVTAYKDSDLDAAAVARLQQDSWNNLVAEFDMINGMFPELDPMTPTRQGG